MRQHSWVMISALMMAIAVGLGAFGAHGLRSVVSAELLTTWQTAVQYHLIHAVALLGLSLFSLVKPNFGLARIMLAILLGILLFSGSLYVWVLTQWYPLVFVTPVGGTIWIISWLGLAWKASRFRD